MEFKENNKYNGFKLLTIKNIKGINAVALIFEHEKTCAKLIKLVNDDDNKVFSIGFRTPPKNSTGVPHILEHSVLCGSRKFDTKEPFVELLKGSLNTFLNAMTYPDKTVYPVASRNEKDFLNLMDVYLDAVLYPNIYKYKEIFMQEGWHYEIDEEDKKLKINGVVYNEMKGAYSSPDSVLFRKIPNVLYPDTCYSLSSGGDPNEIPNLTYEEFLDFHKTYYHPSNSYIFLYGNGDTKKELEFINNYLKNFDKKDINSSINVQKPFDAMKEEKISYGISNNESLDNKTYYSLNFAIGSEPNLENYFVFEVLSYLLVGSTAAPIKKALIENNIGKAVSGDFSSSMKQPIFTILIKNAKEGLEEKFKEIVFNTLKYLVENKIDKELIEAAINRVEFELREGDYGSYPEGLIHYLKIMDSWLYDGDPLLYLEYEGILEKIKTALTTDYFEKIIQKYLLDNSHKALVSLNPVKGLNEKREEENLNKLNDLRNNLSDKDLENIADSGERLKERQNTPDTKESLKCIPSLSLSDINKNVEKLPLEEKEIQGIKTLHHEFHTNKIAYVSILFNTKGVDKELIPYIALLADIIGKCNTKNYDYGKLSNKININTGGISFTPLTVSNVEDINNYSCFMEVGFKALVSKSKEALFLIKEMILNTDFNNENRIKQIISEKKARLENAIIQNGHRIAIKKILSYSYSRGVYDELISGLSYYEFISNLENNYDIDEVRENLKKVRDLIFNKNNMIISYSGTLEDYKIFKNNINELVDYLPSNNIKLNQYCFDMCQKNEGILTQSDVQYVAKGGNYKLNGYEHRGSMSLLETILGFDYLWNNVRVKGGAYGVFSSFRRDGGTYIVSYRDPNIKDTINVYDNIPNYLANFEADDKEMTKYIIGTIRNQDQPLTNSTKGYIATSYYLSGLTYDKLQQEREDILNSDKYTIRSFANMISDVLKQDCVCVLGNENKIKEQKCIFNKLIKISK